MSEQSDQIENEDVPETGTPKTNAVGEEAETGEALRFNAQAAGSIPPEEAERITTDLIAALKTVYDPEIPVDIYELGLVYRVELDDDRKVSLDMTLTAPGCPVAGEMPGWVENAVSTVEGVREVEVRMVFDPPWTPQMMSEEAQVALNWW